MPSSVLLLVESIVVESFVIVSLCPRRSRPPAREDDPRRSPDNIAPPVVFLASTEADCLTGRVIGASGFRISLYDNPEAIREIGSNEPWDIGDAFENIERSFRPAIEGRRPMGLPRGKT